MRSQSQNRYPQISQAELIRRQQQRQRELQQRQREQQQRLIQQRYQQGMMQIENQHQQYMNEALNNFQRGMQQLQAKTSRPGNALKRPHLPRSQAQPQAGMSIEWEEGPLIGGTYRTDHAKREVIDDAFDIINKLRKKRLPKPKGLIIDGVELSYLVGRDHQNMKANQVRRSVPDAFIIRGGNFPGERSQIAAQLQRQGFEVFKRDGEWYARKPWEHSARVRHHR